MRRLQNNHVYRVRTLAPDARMLEGDMLLVLSDGRMEPVGRSQWGVPVSRYLGVTNQWEYAVVRFEPAEDLADKYHRLIRALRDAIGPGTPKPKPKPGRGRQTTKRRVRRRRRRY